MSIKNKKSELRKWFNKEFSYLPAHILNKPISSIGLSPEERMKTLKKAIEINSF